MKFAGFRYHGRKAAMKKVSQRYTEFLQVYFIAGDLDAVGPESVADFHLPLLRGVPERKTGGL